MSGANGSASSVLRIEDHGAVRVLFLNRPDKLNALNTDLLIALRDALAAAEQDDSVRALVLTGEGRGFSAARTSASSVASRPRSRRSATHCAQN